MSTATDRSRKATRERSKGERLEARINKEQKELFQKAADIQGRSLTDFVISSVAEAAKRTVQEHEIMTLSAQDQAVFVQALLNPPEPSQKLRAAAQRYKQETGV
jgi:uncharacterized protein (DUF1778 family)